MLSWLRRLFARKEESTQPDPPPFTIPSFETIERRGRKDAALARCRTIPTSTPGASGLLHLAALALDGDTAKLRAYADRMAQGDRCGFVNFFTAD